MINLNLEWNNPKRVDLDKTNQSTTCLKLLVEKMSTIKRPSNCTEQYHQGKLFGMQWIQLDTHIATSAD